MMTSVTNVGVRIFIRAPTAGLAGLPYNSGFICHSESLTSAL